MSKKKKISDVLRKTIAHPYLVKTSKVATSVLDVASKLGQAKNSGTVAKVSAGLSMIDAVVKAFEITPASSIQSFVQENNLKHTQSALGKYIIKIGVSEDLKFKPLAASKREGLMGCESNDKIFAVKVESGMTISPTNQCYYHEDFDFSILTDRVWSALGEAATLTWNRKNWDADLSGARLRGGDRISDEVQEETLNELQHYLDRGLSFAALLYGPPGTGKTTFVHNIARTLNKRLVTFQPDVINHFNTQTADILLEALRPDMILLDDVDRAEKHGLTNLLAFIEDLRDKYPKMLVFSTCNGMPKNNALLRPGRLGQIIEFKGPSDDEKLALLRQYMKQYGSEAKEFNLDEIVKEMQHSHFTHDYVKMVAEKSTLLPEKSLISWTKMLNRQISLVNKKDA